MNDLLALIVTVSVMLVASVLLHAGCFRKNRHYARDRTP